MGLTQVQQKDAPIEGLKIVRLSGEEIVDTFDVYLNSAGQLVGVIDGITVLVGIPISYNQATGLVQYNFLSDGATVTHRYIAPSTGHGLIQQFHDSVNAVLQWVFNSRTGENVDVITGQVISTAGAALSFLTISRSTGRIAIPQPFRFNPQAEPSSPLNGMVYYDSSTHKLRVYANGAWVNLH